MSHYLRNVKKLLESFESLVKSICKRVAQNPIALARIGSFLNRLSPNKATIHFFFFFITYFLYASVLWKFHS